MKHCPQTVWTTCWLLALQPRSRHQPGYMERQRRRQTRVPYQVRLLEFRLAIKAFSLTNSGIRLTISSSIMKWNTLQEIYFHFWNPICLLKLIPFSISFVLKYLILWVCKNALLMSNGLLMSTFTICYYQCKDAQKRLRKLKFIYSEKATKVCEIFTLSLSYVLQSKIRWRFRKILWHSQNIWTITNCECWHK